MQNRSIGVLHQVCFFLKKDTVAFIESNMLPIGTAAPDFSLPDTVSGKTLGLSDVKGERGTVVMFLCNHCPYVVHVNPTLVRVAHEFISQGIGFVGISSNDIVHYPQDAPDKMALLAKEVGYPFPYLYDESQAVARAYDAACTPDFYVFDAEMKLYYRGRLDASRPKNELPSDGADLRGALLQMLGGEGPPEKQYPSGGCNIKWKSNV